MEGIMLTIKQIGALKPGEWRTDGGARGAGTLVFHASSSGNISAYFRHTLPTGRRYDLPLGLYDETGKTAATLPSLRERAGELSRMYQSGIRDLRAHFEAEARAKAEAEEAALKALELAREVEERQALERERFTLRKLCETYSGFLLQQGKVRAIDAESAFKCHVYPETKIANLSARDITPDHIAILIRKVHEKGKVRMAGVVRSYLMAAFNAATKAKYDATLPHELIEFGVTTNPVSIIPAKSGVTPGVRNLSREELRKYLLELWNDNLIDRVLILHLLSGGQRLTQLLRVQNNDFDPLEGTLRLWDGKGKRQAPREHVIPLAPMGVELCVSLMNEAKNKANMLTKKTGQPINHSLFISTHGATMHPSTPGQRVVEIASRLKLEPFDLRDIRRTVETMLAGLGISRDIRAQLLSHGLSGVQNQHYDRHQYMDEKRKALIAWEQHLENLLVGKETNGKTPRNPPLV